METPSTRTTWGTSTGPSDSVRYPWAIGPPNGLSFFARSTSTWIHWWSPVASANLFTCSWVTSYQSLVPSSVPTRPGSSAMVVVVVVMGRVLLGRMSLRKLVLCLPGESRAQPSAGVLPAASPPANRFTGRVLTSTDGWTTCSLGHRHWGRAGAAGLLLHRDGEHGPELLLQHRAAWSHHGGTWGTPGGALHEGEAADVGALREAQEELGLRPDDVVLGARSVDDHGGWSYTTVLARPARRIEAGDLRLDGESDGVAWLPVAGLHEVDLHPGLAASLPRLRPLMDDRPK